jgi:hypothetical protein
MTAPQDDGRPFGQKRFLSGCGLIAMGAAHVVAANGLAATAVMDDNEIIS